MITPSLRYEACAYAPPAHHAGTSAITAEIAQRLEELEEHRLCASSDLITMLADIHRLSPWVYRMTIALLHGRTEAVTDSFNALAHRHGTTKQQVHTQYHKQLDTIVNCFPHLAVVVEAIRLSGTAIEQPQSHADALRQCVEVSHEL